MHAEKAVIEGNPFIGMYARASESLAVISMNAPDSFAAKVERTLACRVARVSVRETPGSMATYWEEAR